MRTFIMRSVVAGALSSVLLAGCTPDAKSATGGANPTGNAPATTAVAHTYRSVPNLCEVVDWSPLSQVYSSAQTPTHITADAGAVVMNRCNTGLSRPGNPVDGLIVDVNALIATTADKAKTDFERTRQIKAEQHQLTPFPGLGTDGYRFLDPLLGNTFAVYDGNLELTVAWTPFPGATVSDQTDGITELMKATMTSLEQTGSPAAAASHSYRTVPDLCALIDWSPLSRVYSHVDAATPSTDNTPSATVLRCHADLSRPGKPRDGFTAAVAAQIWRSADNVPANFAGTRELATERGQVRPFPGVGVDGIRFADSDVGNAIVVYDGNLELAVSWKALPGATVADQTAGETELMKAIMASLAQG